jgi:hypothetical protein
VGTQKKDGLSDKKNSDHHSTDDGDVLKWPISRTGLNFSDFIDYIHPFNDFAKDGVFCIQEIITDEIDKELASPGVWAGVCHGDRTPVIPIAL